MCNLELQEIWQDITHSRNIKVKWDPLESKKWDYTIEYTDFDALERAFPFKNCSIVARIEEKIQQIVALIDDPETELSTVIRKNVEKAELDAYVKGILFSIGRSKGL